MKKEKFPGAPGSKKELSPLEARKKELADFVFGEIVQLVKEKKFSAKEFNGLLEYLAEKNVNERVDSPEHIEELEKQQKQGETVRLVKSISEKPMAYRFPEGKGAPIIYKSLESQIFEFLPELRARALKYEEAQTKEAEVRTKRQKELIALFDETLQGPRKLFDGLKKQLPEEERGQRNPVVDFLWTQSREISEALKEEKLDLDSAETIIDKIQKAGFKEFTKQDYEQGILPEAEKHRLVKKAWSKTFNYREREQSKKEARQQAEKLSGSKFLYRHREIDPKTKKPILQIDLYRFTGRSEAERLIFNELGSYARLVEPLQIIDFLRERGRKLREAANFRESIRKEVGGKQTEKPGKTWKQRVDEAEAKLFGKRKEKDEDEDKEKRDKGKGKDRKGKKKTKEEKLATKTYKEKRQELKDKVLRGE